MHCVPIVPALLFPRLHTTVSVCMYQSGMVTGEAEKKTALVVFLYLQKKTEIVLLRRKFCKTQVLRTFCLNRRA